MTSRSIPIRLEDGFIARLDALAEALTRRAAGVKVTRAAAMRIAMERGIEMIESEVGAPTRRRKR